jgi:hypothetical protein
MSTSAIASLDDTGSLPMYKAVIERGVFYYPAGRHYGNPSASVVCDRCKRSGIPASIGFDRYDLCLPCVDTVATRLPLPSDVASLPVPREAIARMPTDPSSTYVTLMAQSMFPSSERRFTTRMEHRMYQTKMEQSMFRRFF